MERTATARWTGSLKEGKGTLSMQSGALNNAPYTWTARFESAQGTNPEELIGAAHAGCFTMQVSANINKAGHVADALETTASVTLDKVNGVPTVTKIHLKLKGRVPGMDKAAFDAIAEDSRKNCIISRLLTAEISMETAFG